jgi:ATP-dependent Clp protease ATP-binding subunit ClpA
MTWRELSETMHSRVVGQPEVVRALVDAHRAYQCKLFDPTRPVASLLLLGPTGVGKTHAAEVFAQLVHDEPKLLLIDCASMQMEHDVARLVGAPPGYIGHRETQPMLTYTKLNNVRSKCCDLAVVLFDEFDKAAHPMHQILLGIIDRGVLQLGDGTVVRFGNCVIIVTSNTGSMDYERSKHRPGFLSRQPDAGAFVRAARKQYPPELLARFSHIITCRPLSHADIRRVIDLEFDRLLGVVFPAHPELTLRLDTTARAALQRILGDAPHAREVRRVVREAVFGALMEWADGGKSFAGSVVIRHVSSQFVAELEKSAI